METPNKVEAANNQGQSLLSPPCDEEALRGAHSGPASLKVTHTFSTVSSSSSFSEKDAESPDKETRSPRDSPDMETRSPPLPFTPSPTKAGKPRSAEKSLQKNRPLWLFESGDVTVCIDDEDIKKEDVESFKKKTALTLISVWNVPQEKDDIYEGQMSIVMDPSGDETKQFFLTAAHNVLSSHNDDGELEEVQFLTHVVPGIKCLLPFPSMGDMDELPEVPLRDGSSWKRAEICRGPAADVQSLLHKNKYLKLRDLMEPTKVVDDAFNYAVGTKLAIAAYTSRPAKLAEMPKSLGLWLMVKIKAMLPFIFGPPPENLLELTITTGTITHVGTNHIEYNVNTSGGHSGALVVVWDRTSPYHGQAIALHVGYKDELGANIGFKLQGMSFD